MTESKLVLNVAIGRPYDVRSVVGQCRRLLGTPEAVPLVTKKISNPLLPSGNGRIYHPRDWDLPASLLVHYGIEGPMREQDSPEATGQDQLNLAEDPSRNGWAAIDVEFRPAESWPEISGGRGDDRDLGAWLISELGRWLTRHRLPWRWSAWGIGGIDIPYGQNDLAQLGQVDCGVVTAEDARRIEHAHLASWQRYWQDYGLDYDGQSAWPAPTE